MARCRGIKNDGRRCRNKAITGKNYCSVKDHQNRQISFGRFIYDCVLSKRFIFGICTIIALPSFYYTWKSDRLTKEEQKVQSTVGTLESSQIAEERYIAVGSTRLNIDTSSGVLIREDGDPLVTLHMESGQLYISTTIRNENGEIVAKLQDNEWHLNKKNYFDRNFTNQALEVVNHFGDVVLQVAHFGDVVHIAGIFHREDGSPFSLIPNGKYGALMYMGNSPTAIVLSSPYLYENKNVQLPERKEKPSIPPIFEYPSELHLGSCPGFPTLTNLVRMPDNSKEFTAYRFGSSLDIGSKRFQN